MVSLLRNVSIGPLSPFVYFLIHVYFLFWPLTAVPPLKQRTIKAMLTVQLPRINLFPIYCQVRRPDFYWSFLIVHLYHGNSKVPAPFPENFLLADAVTIF